MRYTEPEWSYSRHYNHIRASAEDELPSCYSSPTSVDAWRHNRMKRTIIPLIKGYPGATWMTIGDGAYGSDAHFLRENGADVLATDINDDRLKIALDKGFIDKFKAENAENISFADNSFDFILCKESYHHFPRPSIAFYEMLRIARRAVVLIEPQETCNKKLLDYTKQFVKKILRKQKSVLFEPSGNYIFRVNIREIEKMMTALNHEIIAIRKLNDFFHPRLSNAEADRLSFRFLVTKFLIGVQNILCTSKLLDYGLATIIAFKQVPPDDLQLMLRHNAFRIINLPQNPFL